MKTTTPARALPVTSSWIKSLAYSLGFLAVFLAKGGAMLFGEVPPWKVGLLAAGQAHCKKWNTDSVGATLWRLVLGQHPCQMLDAEQARELERVLNISA